MSHLDDVRPNAQWAGEMDPGSSDYQRLDDHQSRIVDGDNGGIWSPTGPIGIGGAGITFSTAATQVTGGVTTATGGRVVLANVAGNTPAISSPQNDTIVISAEDMIAPSAVLGAGNSWLQDDWMKTASTPFGAQTVQNSSTVFLPIPRRYLHQGASFSKIKLHFRVPTKPAANSTIPSPTVGLIAFNPSTQAAWGLAPTTLTSGLQNTWQALTPYGAGLYVVPNPTSGGYTTGYYFKSLGGGSGSSGSTFSIFNGVTTVGTVVTESTGLQWKCMGLSGQLPGAIIGGVGSIDAATYYNNGLPQAIELDYDNATGALLTQNAVDHGTYIYGILITGAGDAGQILPDLNIVLHSVELAFTNIVDLRFT